MQGQGFENMGDRTLFWYSALREGQVRLATWERDRLGYVSVDEAVPSEGPHLWTAPFEVGRGGGRVFLNVDGLSEHSTVSVAVTDERFQPLTGLGSDEVDVVANGLRSPVTWGGRDVVDAMPRRVRLRVDFEGVRAQDPKLYAACVVQAARAG